MWDNLPKAISLQSSDVVGSLTVENESKTSVASPGVVVCNTTYDTTLCRPSSFFRATNHLINGCKVHIRFLFRLHFFRCRHAASSPYTSRLVHLSLSDCHVGSGRFMVCVCPCL